MLTLVIVDCGTSIIKTISDVHYKESKQAGIHQSSPRQKFNMGNSPKFPSQNIFIIWYFQSNLV